MRAARTPLLVTILFVALTILFQPGLVRHVGHAFPMSRHAHITFPPEEDVPKDTLLHMGIIAHDVHALIHEPSRLFQWPIFYPHQDTLAYTDHLLAQAVVSFPLWLFTDNVARVHNLLLLLSFVVCGVGAWALVRHLTGSTAAGILAGILWAYWPQRSHDLDQIQLLWCFWMPLALLALHRWSESGRWRHAIGFAVLGAAQCLSGLYLGLYFLTLALPLGAWLLMRSGLLRQGKTWAQIAAGAILAGLLLVPPSLPYLEVRETMGFSRSLTEAEFFSVGLGLYLVPYPGTWLYRLLGDRVLPEGTGQLLGLVPVAMALLGTAIALSRKTTDALRGVVPYVVWTAVAILLSGGPRLRLWGPFGGPTMPGPFGFLFENLAPFQGTRVPARFAYPAVLGLAVLAGAGAVYLLGWLRRPWARTGMTIALSAICFLEMRAEPPDLYRDRIPRHVPRATRWLAENPPGEGILELPANPYLNDAIYVYLASYHHRPIVNGTSGYIPQGTLFLEERLGRFPAQDAIRLAAEAGVRYVVQHDPAWTPGPGEAASLAAPVFTDGSTRIFAVPPATPVPSPLRRPPLPVTGVSAHSNVPGSGPSLAVDGDGATAWSSGPRLPGMPVREIRIDLGVARSVAGIRVVPGSGSQSSWTIRVDTSDDGIDFEVAASELEPESLEVLVRQPGEAAFEAHFPLRSVRFLRLTNPGLWAERWSVAGVSLYTP